jgi:hypothetical protein
MSAGTRRQPFATRWRARFYLTLSEFTARDNPKIKKLKSEELLDDLMVRELDETELAKFVLAVR